MACYIYRLSKWITTTAVGTAVASHLVVLGLDRCGPMRLPADTLVHSKLGLSQRLTLTMGQVGAYLDWINSKLV